MRAVAIALSLQVVAALQFKSNSATLGAEIDSQVSEEADEPECNGCKYAYVTMWINNDELPADMKTKYREPPKPKKDNGGGENHGWKPPPSNDKMPGIKHVAAPRTGTGHTRIHRRMTDAGESEVSEVEGQVEKVLSLSDEMEADAADYESDLAKWTNHLSGKNAIWELAGNLQAVGAKYPLDILTNEKNGILAEQDQLKEKYPNIEIVELKDSNYLWPKCPMRVDTITHLQKLNILGMDQYDKLLWVDADVRMRKSLDYTFQLNTEATTYFMKDDWYCAGADKLTNGGFSTGLMLFTPSKMLLEHVHGSSASMWDCWGDQVIIQHAYGKEFLPVPDSEKKTKMSMKWFPGKTIRYPQCDKPKKGDKAHAIHFVKVKKGFVTPEDVYNPEAEADTDSSFVKEM